MACAQSRKFSGIRAFVTLMRGPSRTARLAAVTTALVTATFAAPALAHIERTAYWPDPRPDTGASPPAGGKVPKVRSLRSALRAKPAGRTSVVCRPDSLRLASDLLGAFRHPERSEGSRSAIATRDPSLRSG